MRKLASEAGTNLVFADSDLSEALNQVLADSNLSEDEIRSLVENMGEKEIRAICLISEDARQRLTTEEKRQLRMEAAAEIREIPILNSEWMDFREREGSTKISLAELYHLVLTGSGRIRSLDFAIRILIAMLKDQRVPQKHKGRPEDQDRAIRLAIAAAMEAKQREFQRNLELVPRLVEEFHQALTDGSILGMERALGKLEKPYFKGPLAKHFQCKPGDLKHLFHRFSQQLEAVKNARK